MIFSPTTSLGSTSRKALEETLEAVPATSLQLDKEFLTAPLLDIELALEYFFSHPYQGWSSGTLCKFLVNLLKQTVRENLHCSPATNLARTEGNPRSPVRIPRETFHYRTDSSGQ